MDADRQAAAHASLAGARPPGAAGPAPEAEALRRAYLDLLKLAVCDLVGTRTMSVGAMPGGTVMARELRGDGRRLRAAGMDWPLEGLTMLGLPRLDDLQACVESVVADGVAGDMIEAGSWRGGASMLIRATLDTLGDGRTVYVADSFQGFRPGAQDESDSDLSRFDFLAVPEQEVRDSFARLGLERGVELVPGYFEHTLPPLAGHPWALVRLDGDTYEATRHGLRCLYPGLAVGGYLILDDYGSFEGCRQAVDEFRAEHGISEPIEPVDFTGARWRRTSAAPVAVGEIEAPAAPAPPPRDEAERDRHVPTAQEVDLAARLAAAEAELERLRADATSGRRAALRRALRP
ncbi:MAG: O-methyltransferase [Solirubrobacteraceae bacterium]|nr:O-methyltransferase [Solirubrobacteraceae bacterium]